MIFLKIVIIALGLFGTLAGILGNARIAFNIQKDKHTKKDVQIIILNSAIIWISSYVLAIGTLSFFSLL